MSVALTRLGFEPLLLVSLAAWTWQSAGPDGREVAYILITHTSAPTNGGTAATTEDRMRRLSDGLTGAREVIPRLGRCLRLVGDGALLHVSEACRPLPLAARRSWTELVAHTGEAILVLGLDQLPQSADAARLDAYLDAAIAADRLLFGASSSRRRCRALTSARPAAAAVRTRSRAARARTAPCTADSTRERNAMHQLIAAPFLDGHLLLRPGARSGARMPATHYEQLRAAAQAARPVPAWAVELAADAWGLDVAGAPTKHAVLIREPSAYGYCRASWEINLGCNFGCKHCYLGERPFSGLTWESKVKLLDIMREAGVIWLQITGGEPTMDPDFQNAYRYAWLSGMMLTISTNGSLLFRPDLLQLFRECPPYRLVVSMYGASEESFDALTRRRGAWKAFRRGMDAARAAGLPLRINVVVTEDNAREADAMAALAREWGVEHHAYTNMTPTIYGGGEPLLAQSADHLRQRKPFAGCNAGHTFFHADPHAKVSICKVGRDEQIDLMAEGVEGLRRLGTIADRLMLRTGGCEGCALSGTCRVCRPLAKHYQEAKAPLHSYCQHGDKEKVTS